MKVICVHGPRWGYVYGYVTIYRYVQLPMYITYDAEIRRLSREAREKKIEKVNG